MAKFLALLISVLAYRTKFILFIYYRLIDFLYDFQIF